MIYSKGMNRQYEQVKSELTDDQKKLLDKSSEVDALVSLIAEVEDIAYNFGKDVGDLDRLVAVKDRILRILISSSLLHWNREEALRLAELKCEAADRVVESAKNLVAEEITSQVFERYNERN